MNEELIRMMCKKTKWLEKPDFHNRRSLTYGYENQAHSGY